MFHGMKTAWVPHIPRVWRSFQQTRWVLCLRSLPTLTAWANFNWAKDRALFPGQETTVGGACMINFFQKYIWESLWHLHLVHNAICSDSQCQPKMSKFLLIWSPQLFEFFLTTSCQSTGLQYIPKIKVTKISADSFLTFSPCKQPYRLQY